MCNEPGSIAHCTSVSIAYMPGVVPKFDDWLSDSMLIAEGAQACRA